MRNVNGSTICKSASPLEEFIVGSAFAVLCLSYFFNSAFLLYLPISFFALLVNADIYIKKATLFITIVIITWFLFLSIKQSFEGFYSWKQQLLIISHFFVSLLLYKRTFSLFTSYGPAIFLSFVLLFFMMRGVNPENVFPNNSQNYISILLISTLLFSVIARKKEVNINVLMPLSLIVLALSVWAEGRGGILVSLVIFLMLCLLKFSSLQVRPAILGGVIKFFGVLIMIGVFVLGIIIAIQSDVLSSFGARGIESTSRIYIWLSYINIIDFQSLLFGTNPDNLPFVSRWRGNLHNSFISAHAYLGLVYLFIIFLFYFYIMASFKRNKILVLMVSCFMLRAFTDTGMISGHFDLLIISSFLYLFYKRRREQ